MKILKRLILYCIFVMLGFWSIGIIIFGFLPIPFSAVMAEKQISSWISGDFHYMTHSRWASMDNISPWVGLAVIASEDQKFPYHFGFDTEAIEKALAFNEKEGGVVRGASTISQ